MYMFDYVYLTEINVCNYVSKTHTLFSDCKLLIRKPNMALMNVHAWCPMLSLASHLSYMYNNSFMHLEM